MSEQEGKPAPPYGFVDRQRYFVLREIYGVDLRVSVDGQDVTLSTRTFDDRPGQCRLVLLRRNERGYPYVDPATGEVVVDVHTEFKVRDMSEAQ